MSHSRRTLLLTRDKWDITLDDTGFIALAHNDFATAQNVSNEVRLFTEDAYFIQDKGIPHFTVEFIPNMSISVLRSYLRRAALRVHDVKEIISIDIISFDRNTRLLTGDIKFTTIEGTSQTTITTYF